MDIITGYLGEPHVTSDQDRDINIGIVGDGSYVMPTGQRIAAEVSNNNEIRIRDGLIIHQGCAASIKKNTYDSVTITNGSQGMKRIDLIVARYQREVETNKETITLVVTQGTPAESDPAVPEHIEGDIQAGDSVADMPLYQVVIDGLNITEVKKVFEEITSLKELNSKIPRVRQDTWVVNGTGVNFVVLLYINDIREMFKDQSILANEVTVVASNGDWGSSPHVIKGTAWQEEKQLLVFLDDNLASGMPIRINSTITVKQKQ